MVDPLSLSSSGYGGLSSVETVVAVVVCKPSDSGARANFSCIGGGYAHRSATWFSTAFIRLDLMCVGPQSTSLTIANSPPSILESASISSKGIEWK